MTRLTIRRGGTKRLRATWFADQAAGQVRDLTGLTLLIIDQSATVWADPTVDLTAKLKAEMK